jgi:hypothetical protein
LEPTERRKYCNPKQTTPVTTRIVIQSESDFRCATTLSSTTTCWINGIAARASWATMASQAPV